MQKKVVQVQLKLQEPLLYEQLGRQWQMFAYALKLQNNWEHSFQMN